MDTNQTLTARVLKEAREALKTIIARNIRNLYRENGWDEPDFANDEEYTVCAGGDDGRPHFLVDVSDPATLYDATEDRTLSRVKLALDGALLIEAEEEDGCEWNSDELSVDELARLARWTEQWDTDRLSAD